MARFPATPLVAAFVLSLTLFGYARPQEKGAQATDLALSFFAANLK